LSDALLAEDVAISQATARLGRTQEEMLATQAFLLDWWSLKRRVAAGGAGAGLVPEWESRREEIDAALSAAWAGWLVLQSDPTASDVNADFQGITGTTMRRAIAAAYWGLYPDAPVAELLSSARPTTGYGGLHLSILVPGTPPVVGWSK
jgi:hypothetical protein